MMDDETIQNPVFLSNNIHDKSNIVIGIRSFQKVHRGIYNLNSLLVTVVGTIRGTLKENCFSNARFSESRVQCGQCSLLMLSCPAVVQSKVQSLTSVFVSVQRRCQLRGGLRISMRRATQAPPLCRPHLLSSYKCTQVLQSSTHKCYSSRDKRFDRNESNSVGFSLANR